MSLTDVAAPAEPTNARARVRAIYRDGSGRITADWPIDRIAEALADEKGILWVDVLDPGSVDNRGVESMFRDTFHFHPLAIEDALKDTHVPKVDDWGTYLYIVFTSIDFDPESDDLCLH
jgi:magnesium transporter